MDYRFHFSIDSKELNCKVLQKFSFFLTSNRNIKTISWDLKNSIFRRIKVNRQRNFMTFVGVYEAAANR
jgi:hypothetical protein